jgi:hypothetical protein
MEAPHFTLGERRQKTLKNSVLFPSYLASSPYPSADRSSLSEPRSLFRRGRWVLYVLPVDENRVVSHFPNTPETRFGVSNYLHSFRSISTYVAAVVIEKERFGEWQRLFLSFSPDDDLVIGSIWIVSPSKAVKYREE